MAAAPFTYTKGVLRGTSGSDGGVVRGTDLEREARVTDILENIDAAASRSCTTEPGETAEDRPRRRARAAAADDDRGHRGGHVSVRLRDDADGAHAVRRQDSRSSSLFSSGHVRVRSVSSSTSISRGAALSSVWATASSASRCEVEDPYEAPEVASAIVESRRRLPVPREQLDPAQPQPLHVDEDREEGHVLDPLAHHHGRRVQHREHAHHGRHGEDEGHRRDEVDGGDGEVHHAHLRRSRGLSAASPARSSGSVGGYVLATLLDRYQFMIASRRRLSDRDASRARCRLIDFVLVALAAIAISFVAALYPSWKASRLDPVEAIRNE